MAGGKPWEMEFLHAARKRPDSAGPYDSPLSYGRLLCSFQGSIAVSVNRFRVRRRLFTVLSSELRQNQP